MSKSIPDGYKENSLGHLVPVSQIPERILAEDELVNELFMQGEYILKLMEMFKFGSMGCITQFINDVGEDLGVADASEADAFATLNSYDAKRKIKVSKGYRMTFGCDLTAAKKLIQECMEEWGENAPPQYRAIAEHAFPTDKEGDINPLKLWELTSLHIEGDERWNKAMAAIRKSVRYEFTKPYMRMHKRNPDGKWEMVSLDFAAISRGDGADAAPVDLPGLAAPVRPIRCEADYHNYMAQIHPLMEQDPGEGPEGDRLAVLAALCEHWEMLQEMKRSEAV